MICKITRRELKHDKIKLILPVGAKVIAVDFFQGKFFITSLDPVDDSITETRNFVIAGEGYKFDDKADLLYIGSCMYTDSHLWHVFEIR